MNSKKTIKNIILGLVVAIVLLGVYAAINGSKDTKVSTGSLSSLTGGGGLGKVKETNSTLANAEILRILGSIENINLNDDIFANPVFRALEDSRFVIPKPIRIGRPNPFLPIGYDVIVEAQFGTEDDDVPQGAFFDDEEIIFFDEDGQPIPQS